MPDPSGAGEQVTLHEARLHIAVHRTGGRLYLHGLYSVSSTGARPHTQRVFTGGRERDGRPNDQPAAGGGYEALVPRRAASCSS